MVAGIAVYLAALSFVAQYPEELTVREPPQPELFSQMFEVRCGRGRLRVNNYGARLPDSEQASLLWNGQRLRGSDVERLRADLSRQGAAYRMMARCRTGRRGISFAFNVGERVYPNERPPGERRYYRGSATIIDGRIDRYSGLEPISEEQFWFR